MYVSYIYIYIYIYLVYVASRLLVGRPTSACLSGVSPEFSGVSSTLHNNKHHHNSNDNINNNIHISIIISTESASLGVQGAPRNQG